MPTSVTHLAPIDLALVALYLVAITIFGLRFSKRNRTGSSLKSYFLADNSIPWWAIALSIVSAETSTLTIVSIPGVAFAGNLGFLQVVLGYMVGRVVVAALFLPKYFRGEMLTAYQLIDRRFGPALHKLTAGLFLLTRAAAEGVRVFAISIVVSIAIGTGDTLSIAIISALTLLYTFEGGMAAVIWTDVVQMALYVAGTLIALFTLGAHVPGSWPHIWAVGQQSAKFHWLDFSFTLTKSYTFWAGLLGGTFLTMASHGTDQLMVQRMLAARNLRESRLALLSSGAVIFLQFTLFLLIGVGLFVFYGTHPTTFKSNDHIFPTFIVHEMPHGVAGLLIAAILAAAMSNLSAALNSLASTTVIDFYVPFMSRSTKLGAPGLAPETWVSAESPTNAISLNTTLVSRASTIVWAVVLFAIAIYCVHTGGKGHVVETGLSIASVAYGCLLGVFLLGTLTTYATQTGAILGMIVGLITNLWLWQGAFPMHLGALTIPHIAFTWYVFIGSLVTFTVGTLFSLVLPRKRIVAIAALVLFLVAPLAWPQTRVPQVSATSSFQPRPGFQPATNASPAYNFTEVDTLLNGAIAAHKLPGAVVLIGHNGTIAYEHAYGNRALEPAAEPMTEDTLFDMASLTKVLVTTTAILQLYEQGKLNLDAPVARYLPDFAANNKQSITVRQLLTHYSGLPEDISLKDDWGLAAPEAGQAKAEGLRRAFAAVPYGPPGTTFKYSDINFITLGALVETLSGQSLDVYAREYIFLPLSMSHTAYHPFDKTCGPAIRTGSAITPGPTPRGRILVACRPDTWSPVALDPNTAPTAHDDQGTPTTNPDFDHLLRGTVHDPTTRRMGGVAGHAGVFSTAEDTSKFCAALLQKLLHNTGPFPLKQATLQQATSPQAPPSAVTTATIFTPDGQTTTGVAQRGLSWDLNTAYSRPRGTIFPIATKQHPGSFGHTGFTGTSLWLDPTTDTYVILLANAIHIKGAASISPLRGQVATAAAKALHLDQIAELKAGFKDWLDTDGSFPDTSAQRNASGTPPFPASSERVGYQLPARPPSSMQPQADRTLTGIDVLEQTHFTALLPYHHLGLLTNNAARDAQGKRTIDVLAETHTLTTIFTPEHGLGAQQDTEHLTAETDPATHIPVHSLYGPKASDKHPRQADLRNLDALVIDLQDAGVRFWTYEALLAYTLEAAAEAHLPVFVLDRPNPIGGGLPQGPLSELGQEAYTNPMPMPVRHGLTYGELARFFNARYTAVQRRPEILNAEPLSIGTPTPDAAPPATKAGLGADLTVIPMQHWHRAQYFADTGVPWLPPSPNLRTLAATILYPGVGLAEQTNISVGRGTATPFENLGAPWIAPTQLAAYLEVRHIPGIRVTPTTLTIAETAEHYPSHGQTIPGIHFEVTDRATFDSPEFGLELLAALHTLYPKDLQLDRAKTLLASPTVLAALKHNDDPRDVLAAQAPALRAFRAATTPYLLY